MSTIIRIQHDQKYFAVSNALFNDSQLSFEARGVMGYLLSKPNGWKARVSDLIAQSPAGRHVVQRILKELEKFGYLHREKVRKENGQFTWVSTVYESPRPVTQIAGEEDSDGGEWEDDHDPIFSHGDENSTITQFSVDGSSVDGKPVHIVSTELVNTDLSSSEGLETDNPPSPNKKPEMKPITEPYGIFQRLAELEPGIPQGQTLRDAKHLLKGNPKRNTPAYCGEDIIACACFLLTDPWRVKNMVSLTSDVIVKKIGKWAAAGKPRNWEEYTSRITVRGNTVADAFMKNNAGFVKGQKETAGFVL